MPFLPLLKSLLKSALAHHGYKIQKIPTSSHWADRLHRLQSLGFQPHVILDGGANQGYWAKKAHQLFPTAHFLLIEPNPKEIPALERNTNHIQKQILQKALWERGGLSKTLHLWEEKTNTSASLLTQDQKPPKKTEIVETTTIDEICQNTQRKPQLIKLDLQGTEIQALRGAKETLPHCQVLLIEFGLTHYYKNRTKPLEILQELEPFGFELQDITDLSYNQKTHELYGGDFLLYNKKRTP